MLLADALMFVTTHICLHIHTQRYLLTHVDKEIHSSLKFKSNINQSKEMKLSVTSPLLKEMDSTNHTASCILLQVT